MNEANGLAEQFAAALQRLQPNAPAKLLELAKQVCLAVAQGHVCLQLPDGLDLSAEPQRIIGTPGAYTPLILDGSRLYLARYWHYETRVAEHLQQRAVLCDNVDLPRLRQDLDRLFPGTNCAHTENHKSQPDWQKLAAAAAVLRRFCVISGGPGTGKTTTVMRILIALQSQADGGLRIGLAAPTGKAAARMQDAVCAARPNLDAAPQLLANIPTTALTLHRLLGSRPDSVYFRHNADNPLPLDVLVVDEASMIDLALMAKLLQALPDSCRLILLGDKDQLASVEAGAVFGDICAAGGDYSSAFCDLLAELGFSFIEPFMLRQAQHERLQSTTRQNSEPDNPNAVTGNLPLTDSIQLLRHSHRFSDDSGIGVLARLCNQGQVEAVLQLLEQGGDGIVWHQTGYDHNALLARIEQAYADYFMHVADAEPAAAFAQFNRFRVLTAHWEGECGAENLNSRLEAAIKARLNLHYRSIWYPGRAVMIARNDYNLRLFNGDIGIALMREGQLRVHFTDADGRIRDLAVGRLPEHQPVYAMTVHKSQGSEFDRVLLVLPDQPSPVLNRPLLYTAVTRAKCVVEICGLAEILQLAIMKTPTSSSGLRDRLLSDVIKSR